MVLYLIDRYKKESKERKLEEGLSIYGKTTKVWMWILIVILISSVFTFAISSFLGLYSAQINTKYEPVNENSIEDESENSCNPDENIETKAVNANSASDNLETVQDSFEKEQDNDVDARNSDKKGDGLSASTIVGIISFVVILASVVGLFVIQYRANNKVVDKYDEILHSRFGALETTIRGLYYKQKDTPASGDPSKEDSSKDERCDVKKVEDLISIYQNEIENIKNQEKRISTIMIGFLSVIGTCIATSLSELDKLQIGLDEWFTFAILLLIIGVLLCLPFYFANEINPTRDKYMSMLNLLRQYHVYLVGDNKDE